MCEYLSIGFIDFTLKGEGLWKYTNIFCLNQYRKNEKIVLKYYQ